MRTKAHRERELQVTLQVKCKPLLQSSYKHRERVTSYTASKV